MQLISPSNINVFHTDGKPKNVPTLASRPLAGCFCMYGFKQAMSYITCISKVNLRCTIYENLLFDPQGRVYLLVSKRENLLLINKSIQMKTRNFFWLLLLIITLQSCSRAISPYEAANYPLGKKCKVIR